MEKINKMSKQELLEYLDKVKEVSRKRVNIEWIVKVKGRVLY